jgi:hypothetical protein
MRRMLLVTTLGVTCAVSGVTQTRPGSRPAEARGPARSARALTGRLPVYFVANRGRFPDAVRYHVPGARKSLFFTDRGVTISLHDEARRWALKLDFVGAAARTCPVGRDRQPAVFSYFRGKASEWTTGAPTYAEIAYHGLWPGIDLVYRGTVGRLKYAFHVGPGADPSRIRLRYRGASAVRVTDAGTLRVETPAGSLEDAVPVAWQEIDGRRIPVTISYAVGPRGEFGFEVGAFDPTRPLVLDPVVLVYCGYIGGGDGDTGNGIALDAAGNVYVTGTVRSDAGSFPVRVGPDLTFRGSKIRPTDAFVAKVNAAGTALLYCGYLGGSHNEKGNGIAVDTAGNAYVTGETWSTDFPRTVGPDLTLNGGADIFISKVNAKGTSLVYSGFLGGTDHDSGHAIAVDRSGGAYVTGWVWSDEKTFPVKVGPDLTKNSTPPSPLDAFVAKVNANGTGLVYCGYIGGSGQDSGHGIAVDTAGSAYVTGFTESDQRSFPVRVGPDLTHNFNQDAFVAKVSPNGGMLTYCGYIGGSRDDEGRGIDVDAAGNAYVTGTTWSDQTTFPVRVGPDTTFSGTAGWVSEAFVAKVAASGKSLAYCGYVGGSDDELGRGIGVDASGNAFVTGWTYSTDKSFPVAVGPDVTFNGGGTDAFIAMVTPSGTGFGYCGYIGGNDSDMGEGIAVDPYGNAYVTGTAASDEHTFPVRRGPDLTQNDTGAWRGDAFVTLVARTPRLEVSGAPRPGGTVDLRLFAYQSPGLSYQVGTSFGSGPIILGTRRLDLSLDALLELSVTGLAPSIFVGYRGVIDATGRAQASIRVPKEVALVGTRLHSAFVTLRPQAPFGIHAISNTFMFVIGR